MKTTSTPIAASGRLAVTLVSVLAVGLALYVAWKVLIVLALLALVAMSAVLLGGQLRAFARQSGAPVGWPTWCLMAVAGVYAFVVVSVHAWAFTDTVVAAAAVADRHLTWADVDEIRACIDVPANSFAAFYLGPLGVLIIRDLMYRAHRRWSDLRREGVAKRQQRAVGQTASPMPPPVDAVDDRLFRHPGEEPLPVLPPEKALARSRERLTRLERLVATPHLSDERRGVIRSMVEAQADFVVRRWKLFKRAN